MGINWTLVNWKAPYTNNYPTTLIGGSSSRRFSAPLFYGHFANRTGRNTLRQLVLYVPTFILGLEMFFNLDVYQMTKCYYYVAGTKVPDEIERQHAKDMDYASWNKPGVMAKHHFGGTISIPGSEKFVTEM